MPRNSRAEPAIPDWDVADLPEPRPLRWRDATRLIGPGVVMMGMQIGGGEWLFGPEVTARYGGGLLWIATIAIILQVFYNLECGRYALYCGEPIFTGFLRTRPSPKFWMAVILLLNANSLIPGLSTHGAAMAVALWLGRPPDESDRALVTGVAYAFLALVSLPVLLGGKVYNTLQAVMTVKVVVVLGFCLAMGLVWVSPQNWWDVFSGFAKFGTLPSGGGGNGESTVNVLRQWWSDGTFPVVALGNIAMLGAFAGYAGGGGLSNAAYGNYVRDKGWGMGSTVGAIPSAVGGRGVTLSHVGKVFPINDATLPRWRNWWRYLLRDQVAVWVPGCFMGMALPALLSLQFAPYSSLRGTKLEWAQSLITADGARHAPGASPAVGQVLWTLTVLVGLLVMLPSQMSIVDDFSRRWTDILWSGSRRVRTRLHGHDVWKVYYTILGGYVAWTFVCAYLFNTYGTPRLMTVIIANLNNLAIGVTAVLLLWINCTRLPPALRPRWYQRLALALCGLFYLGITALVFVTTQLPLFRNLLGL